MSKIKKLLTLEDLAKFCESNKFNSFNSKESGYELVVQVPADLVLMNENIEFKKKKNEEYTKGLLFCNLKVCHTLLNRNGSYIHEADMKDAMPSLKYRPVLAKIHQLDDGTYDFHSHDMIISEDENGEEKVEYIESQIGSFTNDEPYLEYDKENDKTYVIATAVIPEDYTMASEIIKRKNGSTVSCELSIEEMSYNAKEKYLELKKFHFLGVTCLGAEKDGKEIKPGMEGARLDIADFSEEKNSLICHEADNTKLVEVLEKLDSTLSNLSKFNINIKENSEEGGKTELTKFEELLQKYNKTEAEIEFEIEGLSDEELEARFAEVFENEEDTTSEEKNEEDTQNEEDTVEPKENAEENSNEEDKEEDTIENAEEDTVENQVDENEDDGAEKFAETENIVKYTVEVNGKTSTFQVSLNEKINALQTLVNTTYEEADGYCYYSVIVYDKELVMIDYWNGRAYRQTYKADGDSYSLTGDRVEVYATYVTKEEEAALDEMKSNYSSIANELNAYKSAEEYAEKMKVFEDEAYLDYLETDEFKSLMNEESISKFSKDELVEKADATLGRLVKKSKAFSFNEKNTKSNYNPIRVGIYSNFVEDNNNEPYGDYFKSIEA